MRRPIPAPECPACGCPAARDQFRRWDLTGNDGACFRCIACDTLVQLRVLYDGKSVCLYEEIAE